jgi:UDP-N-acetylglucosamine--N-acetylmuramyl-(pentapeptide) pyrophosphoryl-undecaprenol N-acetylglucosamine transferase
MTDSNNAPLIVLAAGGTGGHIFPAEALAEELQSSGLRVALITDSRFRDYKGALATIPRHTVRAGTFGRGILGKITAAADILLGIYQARKLLKRLRPIAVVGFGGYPSYPTMHAASSLKIPTIIHEQNSVLGRANRMLMNRVDSIATTFPDTRCIAPEVASKVTLTGNPVRAGICALYHVPYPEIMQDGHIRILVTGGSQGASIFSQVVPAAIAALPPPLRARVRVDQQCREQDVDTTRAAYVQMGVSADISTFFTDIPARLAAAHLVIARAGASTLAELTAAGRPAIVVPLPGAMDNHQYFNASSLEASGAGWTMPQDGFTAAALSARIEAFLSLPEALARAAEAARKAGKENAARALSALVLRVADKHNSNGNSSTPSVMDRAA